MDVFIRLLVYTYIALICSSISAQTDTIYLSTLQAEDLFIKQNLELIAEKLNIDVAEAAIVQAKLWRNPTLNIGDVNVWNTDRMRDEMSDIFPDASFAPNKQFSVGIEQIIVMGGKRRKLVEMEKLSRDIAVQYYEELVRSLKVELRNTCAELLFLQDYRKVLEKQRGMLDALIGNYRRQVDQGNLSRSEYLRLQAELLGLRSEINDLQKDMNEQQKALKTLLNISTPGNIALTAIVVNTKAPEEMPYSTLFDMANASRPDLKEAMFQKDFSEKTLRYEKAQRTPDLSLSAMFDRAGGVVRNYWGFGMSIDLPFFDRNQGGVRAAQISIRKNQTLLEHKQLEVRNEVVQAMQNYTLAYNFNREIADEFIDDLDEMLESYHRNFLAKNIGIVEFLDFFEAYRDNRQTVLEAQKAVKQSFEVLQYAVGVEIQ